MSSTNHKLISAAKITTIVLRQPQPSPEAKPKPKPIEEDEYYSQLEKIIARDFFPSNLNSSSEEEPLPMSIDEF